MHEEQTTIIRILRQKYEDMKARSRDIRQQVRNEYKSIIDAEISRRIDDNEREFARELVEARRKGVLRRDLSYVIKTQSGDIFKRYMDLGGWEKSDTLTASDRRRILDAERFKGWFTLDGDVRGVPKVTVYGNMDTRERFDKPMQVYVGAGTEHVRFFTVDDSAYPQGYRESPVEITRQLGEWIEFEGISLEAREEFAELVRLRKKSVELEEMIERIKPYEDPSVIEDLERERWDLEAQIAGETRTNVPLGEGSETEVMEYFDIEQLQRQVEEELGK